MKKTFSRLAAFDSGLEKRSSYQSSRVLSLKCAGHENSTFCSFDLPIIRFVEQNRIFINYLTKLANEDLMEEIEVSNLEKLNMKFRENSILKECFDILCL